MIGIVERLRFDATRCEIQFSKGVAGNIEEAANEIERLRAALELLTEELPEIERLTAALQKIANLPLEKTATFKRKPDPIVRARRIAVNTLKLAQRF